MIPRSRTLCARIATAWLAIAGLALPGVPIRAQDLTIEAPPQSHPIALVGGTIHTGDGATLDPGVLWFADGRIRGLGSDARAAGVPPGAVHVDVSGRHVWPGLVDAVTQVGLIEIESISATRDVDEIGDVTPEAIAALAINPDATTIPVTRSNGVLTVGAFPSGGLLPGRASVVELAGWTWEEMAVRVDAGLIVDWPGRPVRRPWQSEDDARRAAERTSEQLAELDRLFDDAAAWLAARDADAQGVGLDLGFAAMGPALRGERPVFVRADDVGSIRAAIGWAVARGLRPVIVGGADADQCLDLLREHDVAVVIAGTHRLPRRRDHAPATPFRLPALLHAAGVRFCIAGEGGFENERNLPYEAATAVAYGLPLDAALRAVTLGAAECLELGADTGSLAVGKRATLMVTDGHPLEVRSRVLQAWCSGRALDLSNKQTRLADKYRERYRQLGLWPRGR
ncbi:MAG: amidohydrolase family protein [Planctomycetes bacterium]|nr:amidohydrolase family protein [Planctomycetota bacterium]